MILPEILPDKFIDYSGLIMILTKKCSKMRVGWKVKIARGLIII